MKHQTHWIKFLIGLAFSYLMISNPANADFENRWQEGQKIPIDGRPNVLNLDKDDFIYLKRQGQIHAQIYPVDVTGLLPPYNSIKNFIEGGSDNFLRKILSGTIAEFTDLKSFDQILTRLGLHDYPKETDSGIYQVPYPKEKRPDTKMGFGTIIRYQSEGFTFSCAACHSGTLFGKTVLGLTNRFPRANEFFVQAKTLAPLVESHIFQGITGATDGEVKLLTEVKNHIRRVGTKIPLQRGLDTSLAQVALSLNFRNEDSSATPSRFFETFPRQDPFLDNNPADSKPAVWWNVKYKNRWLSDGSVISGNPIFTNIIWNEIGRGIDLKVLEDWLSKNQKIVDELTTAVFSSEAPRYTDFFPPESISLERAQRGEQIFDQRCAGCHGQYEKAWSQSNAHLLNSRQILETTRVIPKPLTPIKNVGTDPYRRWGMKSLEKLNNLSISQKNNIVIKAQEGYVPPPLVGIWARWPYMHNNSMPTLCSVLTASSQRPRIYYAGEAINPQTDFDSECVGYPLNEKTPSAWIQPENRYETYRIGMSNSGHDEGIFLENGQEILSVEDKKDLIQFLKTL